MLTERQNLGNYLQQNNLEQMLLGLQATLGAEATSQLVEQAGEKLGRATVQDWQLGSLTPSSEQLPMLLEAALGREGHGLCRVRQVQRVGDDWQVKARLPQYALLRTLSSAAMRGMLSELLGEHLSRPDIAPDGLLLSNITFTPYQPKSVSVA